MLELTVSAVETLDPSTAAQQPQWLGHPAYQSTRTALAAAQPLVTLADLLRLRRSLAAVATGEARLLQLGDCAESFYECTAAHTDAKLASMKQLADHWELLSGQPVLRVGRLGGQFAKPRSAELEWVDGYQLAVFRGHLVNSDAASHRARQHDPRRMLSGYHASARVLARLADHRAGRAGVPATGYGPWSSHEALVLDYESSLIRTDPDTGMRYLASTHLPWVGLRTHQPRLPHVRMLAGLANAVGCKIGPGTSEQTVLELCEVLDPERTPGRLVLITRMGANLIEQVLPSLVSAVRNAGYPVVWLSDPMHGNTVLTSSGHKTRYLSQIQAEVRGFRRVLEHYRVPAGGLHLEMAVADVTECVGGLVRSEVEVPLRYRSLCDPRLNPAQALQVVSGWR